MSGTTAKNKWERIPWDGNPDLGYECWRRRFRRGHVSVGIGEFKLIVFSYGANSDHSYSSTRGRVDAPDLTELEAMERVDLNDGYSA